MGLTLTDQTLMPVNVGDRITVDGEVATVVGISRRGHIYNVSVRWVNGGLIPYEFRRDPHNSGWLRRHAKVISP